MGEKEIQKLLIELLRAAVNGVEENAALAQKITGDHLAPLYRLAKKHDVAHIVSCFVNRNKIEIANDELRIRLQQEELLAVYRHERMKHAYKQICSAFDEACIPYVPLKGAVIRAYYPDEHIRTSCDIDILVHEEDLERAIACLEQKGFLCGKRNYHDVSLYSPNKTHLELHFNIQENMDALDNVLKDAWKHTSLVQGSRHDFNQDFFVFHMYAHMAYHFLSGGCGIRSLLDLWIMEHRMGAHYSCAEDLLKEAGIHTFASEMCGVANRCFTDGETDAFSDPILKYILSGGVYGTRNSSAAIQKTKTKNLFLYARKRLFPPYKTMKGQYPVLARWPFLLPFCWLMRCGSYIFRGKTKKAVSELSSVSNVSSDTIAELTEICSRLGI